MTPMEPTMEFCGNVTPRLVEYSLQKRTVQLTYSWHCHAHLIHVHLVSCRGNVVAARGGGIPAQRRVLSGGSCSGFANHLAGAKAYSTKA